MSNLEKKLLSGCSVAISDKTVTVRHKATGELVEVEHKDNPEEAKKKALLLLADKLGRKEPPKEKAPVTAEEVAQKVTKTLKDEDASTEEKARALTADEFVEEVSEKAVERYLEESKEAFVTEAKGKGKGKGKGKRKSRKSQ